MILPKYAINFHTLLIQYDFARVFDRKTDKNKLSSKLNNLVLSTAFFLKTCEQKKAVLDITRGQILPLSPLNSYSGCKYIQISGVDYVECKDTQKFSSSRDMWWYLVLSRCPSDRIETVK